MLADKNLRSFLIDLTGIVYIVEIIFICFFCTPMFINMGTAQTKYITS
jgi:hypothetical protein